jgi:hypothetical protein
MTRRKGVETEAEEHPTLRFLLGLLGLFTVLGFLAWLSSRG